jgi:hypothetical protein
MAVSYRPEDLDPALQRSFRGHEGARAHTSASPSMPRAYCRHRRRVRGVVQPQHAPGAARAPAPADDARRPRRSRRPARTAPSWCGTSSRSCAPSASWATRCARPPRGCRCRVHEGKAAHGKLRRTPSSTCASRPRATCWPRPRPTTPSGEIRAGGWRAAVGPAKPDCAARAGRQGVGAHGARRVHGDPGAQRRRPVSAPHAPPTVEWATASPTRAPRCVSFTDNGRRVLSASNDKTIKARPAAGPLLPGC